MKRDRARLYTAAEVGDAQYSEAELIAKPLRAETKRLEAECLYLADLITYYWIPRTELLEAEIERLRAALNEGQ